MVKNEAHVFLWFLANVSHLPSLAMVVIWRLLCLWVKDQKVITDDINNRAMVALQLGSVFWPDAHTDLDATGAVCCVLVVCRGCIWNTGAALSTIVGWNLHSSHDDCSLK